MASPPTLSDAIREHIVVLDGATATMLQGRFVPGAPVDRLCLTEPERISTLHRAYLDAGAEIISTNSFNAAGLPDGEEIARTAARLARMAADAVPGPRWVAGVLGPTAKSASLAVDGYSADFDTLRQGYLAAARGLIAGGADLLLIETIFDAVNAKAAIYAARALDAKIPLLISATVTDASGRLLAGQDLEAFWIAIEHAHPLAVGLNCAFGAAALRPHLQTLARAVDVPILVYPNAGLPDAFGHYGESPQMVARALRGFAEDGLVNIVGGCCGTTPSHIAALKDAVKGLPPRTPPKATRRARLSGLAPLTLDNGLTIAGERTSVSGSARFGAAIRNGDMRAAVAVARTQIEAGARIIDLALDEALLDGAAAARDFLRAFQAETELARVPVMIDSAQPSVVEAALKTLQGKGLVNSISLKDGEEAFLARARAYRDLGAALVVMAFDEQGQADDFSRMTAICARAYGLLTERLGISPEDIFFDPNLLPIATGVVEGRGAARDFIRTLAWIKMELPGAGTLAGTSAVSFAFRGSTSLRAAMHAVFLHHARAQGLDIAILNANELTVEAELSSETRSVIEDALFDRRADAAERLLALSLGSRPAVTPQSDWRKSSVDERLVYALVQGRDDFIGPDVEEARVASAHALDVIEGPLMAGMAEVGRLFAAGQLFLPQMIKSARVMSRAVDQLTPHLEREGTGLPVARGKIVLATVRGDVHDIGKSIVAAVLRAANYTVIDLGVMVPAARVIEAARSERVDLIGLSGLITPSLEEMALVAAELEREGLQVPLMIGGAATTATHTAVRIAPEYAAPVAHVRDAAEATQIAAALLRGEDFEREQESLRARFATRLENTKLLPLAEARARALPFDANGIAPPPRRLGVAAAREDLAPLVPLIDWLPFFRAWGFTGSIESPEAHVLLADARTMLARIVAEDWIEAHTAVGLFPARRDGDDVVVAGRRLPMLRQQMAKTKGRANLCLADFVAVHGDHIGVFAVTAGLGVEARVAAFEAAGDTQSAILLRALADRLAEALAERLHARVRAQLWGFPAPGIRPAPGYPACPDHGLKRTIFDLLGDAAKTMTLSETFALSPAASIAGFYLAHPAAHYFGIGRIGRDQVADYAKRARLTPAETERRLAPLLGYRP